MNLLKKLVRQWDEDACDLIRCPNCQSVVMRDMSPFEALVHSRLKRQREPAQLMLCIACKTPVIVVDGLVFDGSRWIGRDEIQTMLESLAKESQAFLDALHGIRDAIVALKPPQQPGPADHFEFVVGTPRPKQ